MTVVDYVFGGLITLFVAISFLNAMWPSLVNAITGMPNDSITLVLLGLIGIVLAAGFLNGLWKKTSKLGLPVEKL